jgi:sRNA-binding carbon storage regulator CsrA
MLVLTLKPGKHIQIGPDTFIRLADNHGSPVKLVIDAPRRVEIVRSDAQHRLDPITPEAVDALASIA